MALERLIPEILMFLAYGRLTLKSVKLWTMTGQAFSRSRIGNPVDR